MTDYTVTYDFSAKDSLSTGDPNKLIKGSEVDTETAAVATAVATKANKITSATTNNVIKQDGNGDLVDTGHPTPTGTFVGISDSQTLTNKTLTAPVVSALTLSDGDIIAEGTTADAFETTLTFTDPTADRTVTVQDATHTLIGRDTTDTLTNKSISGTQIDSGTLPTARIAAGSLVAAKIDFTLATGGSWSIAGVSTQVIPAGLYMAIQQGGAAGLALELNQASTWRTSDGTWTGGLLLSDGTNLRIVGNSADTATVYYRQLA